MKCPFCKSENISETSNKIPRGNKKAIEEDENVKIIQGFLHEMKCNNCNKKFFVDIDILNRIKKYAL